MSRDDAQVAATQYEQLGWWEPPISITPTALQSLYQRIDILSSAQKVSTVREEDGVTVRALHGCHEYDDLCALLTRDPALVSLAETLLDSPVYVYQFKVNLKQPKVGQAWPWHQDFTFWHIEDGMPEPRAVNVMIALDEVTTENGPVTVLTGSHELGLFRSDGGGAPAAGTDWRHHVSARLAHTVPDDDSARLSEKYSPHSLTGNAGSIVAFHPSLIHSSKNNRSPERRAIILITYNSINNIPTHVTRPDFLVSRNANPVTAAPAGLSHIIETG